MRMPPAAAAIVRELAASGNPQDARFLQGFFKTGPGQYGEGDRFLGIRVPVLRRIARRYGGLPLRDALALLHSPWHEARFLALVILVNAYARADGPAREEIFVAYLANASSINNWDLVDSSAPAILGEHLLARACAGNDEDGQALLDRLAGSDLLWERRIAVLASAAFIRAGRFEPTLRLAACLLGDAHDLMHKAVGWMLREVGKRDRSALETFLAAHYRVMPRTMLRYAIERLPEPRRKAYLTGEV
jgi:3-methyladenine DNA glycosylase AlkD